MPERVLLRSDRITLGIHELRHLLFAAMGVEDAKTHHHPWWHLCTATTHPLRFLGWFGLHRDGATASQSYELFAARRTTLLVPVEAD